MKLSEQALKDQLITLAEKGFELPEESNIFQRTQEMLPHLGAVDSELRDDLIYSCLASWMLNEAELYSEDEYQALLQRLLGDEHLFYRIGESGTDSIFMRSFSLLLLPLILAAHQRRPFLSRDQLLQLKERLFAYLEQEQDRRGFVEEEDKGWAHAVAHAADTLDELAHCQELKADDLNDILGQIRQQVAHAQLVYNFEEDERLCTPVISCLSRKLLKEPDVRSWLDEFVPLAQETEPFPDSYRQAVNIKLFLRSLYFRAIKPETAVAIGENSAKTLADLVMGVLGQISRF